jgi:hypothetical protein
MTLRCIEGGDFLPLLQSVFKAIKSLKSGTRQDIEAKTGLPLSYGGAGQTQPYILFVKECLDCLIQKGYVVIDESAPGRNYIYKVTNAASKGTAELALKTYSMSATQFAYSARSQANAKNMNLTPAMKSLATAYLADHDSVKVIPNAQKSQIMLDSIKLRTKSKTVKASSLKKANGKGKASAKKATKKTVKA